MSAEPAVEARSAQRVHPALLLHDGGTAHMFGIAIAAPPPAVPGLVSRVSVEASFFKRMSPDENLSHSARLYGLTPTEPRTAIPAILRRDGAPLEWRGKPMEGASPAGCKPAIALARALLTSPVLFLLDGPTTGLDAPKIDVQELSRDMRRRSPTGSESCMSAPLRTLDVPGPECVSASVEPACRRR